MTSKEAVNWIINIMADIGKSEHSDLWHYEQALSEIREMLEAQPMRKRGTWLQDDRKWICSECGELVIDDDHNFCPNCGADMRGDADEID